MSEADNRTKANSSSTTTTSEGGAAAAGPHNTSGGRGGRGGRGRGRGRSSGRGGRGRGGNQRHVDNGDRTNNEETKKSETKAAESNHAISGAGRGRGGRGRPNGGRGRSSGRGGRGRGGRGRGGRGRGHSSAKDTGSSVQDSRSNSPMPPETLQDEAELLYVEEKHQQVSVSLNPDALGDQAAARQANPILETFDATQQLRQTLSLPVPPRHVGGKGGVPMILSRRDQQHSDQDYDKETQALSERLAASALDDYVEEEKKEATGNNENHDAAQNKPPKPPKKKFKKRNKKDKDADETPVEPEEPQPQVTTSEALQNMPAQEVSISASTTVTIRRSESSVSVNKAGESAPIKFDGTSRTGKAEKKSKKGKKKALSKDNSVNQKAAKAFNKAVRACVERSDPIGVRKLLRDKSNHHFALDKIVLETVMKAYVVAAMFDDGLYCLRNCALPGTLSTAQTERILSCLPQNLRNSSSYSAADMINALCIATEFESPNSRTYFLRIIRGISLEFLEEVISARDRICSAPCERLVRSAVCVVAARLKRGKKPADLVVHPGDQLGIFIPDSAESRGIQTGDAVSILPYAGPYPMSVESLDRNMLEAIVTNMNPMVLRLQDKQNTELYSILTSPEEGNIYRIDKLANRMGFNRQLSAAVAIASPLGESKTRDVKRPSPQLIKAISAMDENIERVMNHNLDSGGVLTSTAALCSEAVPWSFEDEGNDGIDDESIRATSHLALEKYNALEGLNDSQRLAVEGAVTNRLTLVQGPPGTGKTAVAIRILQHWARLAKANAGKGEQPAPILATSDSNIAVDNLVEGCAAVGLDVVRLGRPEAIRPELLRFCIDRPPSSYDSSGNRNSNPTMAFNERMKSLKKAQIVCCTCIGSGGDILDSMTFDRVLVDEATQATEPAVLVPLMRGCRQLVLVGDHCQLPPTVLSTRAEEEGHGVPLFSRMVACGVPPFMLDTQYRMHPCIAMFPSDLFYGGKLNNGVSAPERRPLAGFPWPREEFPVAFLPVQGIEMDDGVSKMNEEEAMAACEAVAGLLAGGQCKPSDIAVVTPYAAQARLIRRLTRQLIPQASKQVYIEVSSVDGFQGREKEAVVFSAVRSNDHGAIGFTSDWRRVNVSFTRARRALIVIGNDVTLRRGDPDTWMPWLQWADAHGLNMDKPGVSRGRYDPEQLRRVRGGTTAAEMLKDVLARQQAQLKIAERQLEKAEKDAAGHIIGNDDDDDNQGGDAGNGLTLEEDLAQITNADGNWDSDDEDDGDLRHSTSQPTLSSAGLTSNASSSGGDSESPVDVWDL